MNLDKNTLSTMDKFQRHFLMARTDVAFIKLTAYLRLFERSVEFLIWNHPYTPGSRNVLWSKTESVWRELTEKIPAPEGYEDIKNTIAVMAIAIREDVLSVQYGFDDVAQYIIEEILTRHAMDHISTSRSNTVIK